MVRYKDIEFGKLIGRGSQGEVFLANWKGSIVAIKKVDTRLVPADVIDEFLTEADLICRLRHPCLCLYALPLFLSLDLFLSLFSLLLWSESKPILRCVLSFLSSLSSNLFFLLLLLCWQVYGSVPGAPSSVHRDRVRA